MADLLQEIEAQIAGAKATAARQNVGVIREIGDGVARIEGLDDAMLNEMIDLGHGITGLALNLDETEVGVVILGDYTLLEEGAEARTTGKLLQVPVLNLSVKLLDRAGRSRRYGQRRRDEGRDARDRPGDPRTALHKGRRKGEGAYRDPGVCWKSLVALAQSGSRMTRSRLSAFFAVGGAPPPPTRVGPHPHAKSGPPARRS